MRPAPLWYRLSGGPARPARRAAGFVAGVAALLSASLPAAAAEAVTVVASIKPVHSLVAGVMEGAGSPHLIVQGGNSPHSYSLRPSDATALQRAKVVVWVGEGLETFLESSIATLAKDAEVVELAEAPGLRLLAYREGGPWAEHAHEHEDDHAGHEEDHEEGHAEHEAHADHEEGHDHDEGHEAAHDHDTHHDEDEHHDEEHHAEDGHGEHGEFDMHIWLDPDNAKAMVAAIAAALVTADPENSSLYRANAQTMSRSLDELASEIERDLAPVKEQPFVVFHDAYQYFDRRFGLNTVGSVTVDPERKPGAARLKEIQAKIKQLGARCVFAEPQFEPRLVQVAIEGTNAKTGIFDPVGADLADGPELYFELLRNAAVSLKACLSETG